MDIAYDGTWGYHPLVVSLANTGEVLSLVNRSGNRPSHEGAAEEVDLAILLCRRAASAASAARRHRLLPDRAPGPLGRRRACTFIFGYDAMPNLKALAEDLPASAWQTLQRPPRYEVKTQPRQRPDKVKDRIVRERGFETLTLGREEVAEFDYRPTACQQTYRMVVVRKNLSVEKGEQLLFDEIRYFFYLTNDRECARPPRWCSRPTTAATRRTCSRSCNGGVRALRAPVDNLESNWAYMVMTALAWNLKAWWALSLPEEPRQMAGRTGRRSGGCCGWSSRRS